MGSFIIILTNILVLTALLIRSIRNNKKVLSFTINSISEINNSYKELLNEKNFIIKSIEIGMILSAEIFTFISIFTIISRYINRYLNLSIDWLISIFAMIISMLIVYYSIGYILLVSSKIHRFIYGVEDKTLKIDFILSYFITSTFLVVLLIFPEQFKNNSIVALLGVSICYYLNIKILLTIMINPNNNNSNNSKSIRFRRIMIASILILIMSVINLFLAVCLVNSIGNGNAYSNIAGNFDLFYYTIITFTTIGYGDIVPLTRFAKTISIIISITSVICLSMFLGSILSYKDKFKFM